MLNLPTLSRELVRTCNYAALILFVSAAAFVGCSSKSTKPKPATAKAESTADSEALDPSVANTVDSAASNDKQENSESDIDQSSADEKDADTAGGADLAVESKGMGGDSGAVAENIDPVFESGNWTTKRLFALGTGGPFIIELQIGIAGQSLEEASAGVTEKLAEELFADIEKPVTWEKLIEHPLVKSGWLGNLVADEDQESQLIGMYDSDQDDEVGIEELGAFLSRGLARNDPLQVSDIGNAPDRVPNISPWDVMDQNDDHSLDQKEIEELEAQVSRMDYNGDSIVALPEISGMQNTTQAQGMGMNSMSMLDTTSLIIGADLDAEDPEVQSRAIRGLAQDLLEHYTFLEGIPRDQWKDWTDTRWKQIDENGDDNLVRNELKALATIEPDAALKISFPNLEVDTEEPFKAHAMSPESDEPAETRWQVTNDGGRLAGNGCVAEVAIEDAYGQGSRQILRQRLAAAIKDTQLQTFFTSQLQLKEGAFDLVDSNENEKLDDEEFESVWRWLSARQGTRMLARWMIASRPWFQILDEDGDKRLTSREMSQAAATALRLDADEDGLVTPNELPLLVRLELRRTDNRLNVGNLGLPNQQEAASPAQDWFAAMDTNNDGYIANDEFLGESDDFELLDEDKDGFLVREEVY